MRKYILDDDGVTPVLETDLHKWGKWTQDSIDKKRVALDKMDGYRVSTVFLAIDHSFPIGGDADVRPVLWETIVFFPECEQSYVRHSVWRYHTREEAVAGHAKIRDRLHDLLHDLLLQKAGRLEVAEELSKLEI